MPLYTSSYRPYLYYIYIKFSHVFSSRIFCHSKSYIQLDYDIVCPIGAGAMAQLLKALAALPKNLDLISSAHIAVHNCL